MREVRIGTSGWSYDHWQGKFYPEDLPKSRRFAHLLSVFDTVEINYTFYRTPRESTVRRWYEETPEGFLWAVKGSRYVSHNLHLHHAAEAVQRQNEAIQHLGPKLGPVLWQLPERGDVILPALAEFLRLRPPWQRWCFEFRNRTFLTEPVYQLLREHECVLVWADLAGAPFAAEVTGPFLYGRLHGHEQAYVSRYTDDQLHWWRDQLQQAAEGWRDIFVYFDNDAHGHAPFDALRLRELLTP